MHGAIMFEEIYTNKKDEIRKKLDQQFRFNKMIKALENYGNKKNNEFVELLRRAAINECLTEKQAECLLEMLKDYNLENSYLFYVYKEQAQKPFKEVDNSHFRKKKINPNEILFDYAK